MGTNVPGYRAIVQTEDSISIVLSCDDKHEVGYKNMRTSIFVQKIDANVWPYPTSYSLFRTTWPKFHGWENEKNIYFFLVANERLHKEDPRFFVPKKLNLKKFPASENETKKHKHIWLVIFFFCILLILFCWRNYMCPHYLLFQYWY